MSWCSGRSLSCSSHRGAQLALPTRYHMAGFHLWVLCTQGQGHVLSTVQTTKTAQSHQCLYWYGKRPMPGSPWPPSSVGEGDKSLHHVPHVLAQAALCCGP